MGVGGGGGCPTAGLRWVSQGLLPFLEQNPGWDGWLCRYECGGGSGQADQACHYSPLRLGILSMSWFDRNFDRISANPPWFHRTSVKH
eukprot:NODE_8096_length_372_cov_37.238390_g6364_i0.p1 GENE.NODE_8096_length_372_cov_37.238390_g6364_i0~~NODE_8096_length_372_cov_37.238390_g6364_i0.p1  ORF type:complete len:95 (-),score=1.72 NODE_8096_length_372_cov_37.238390_g6364_i0:88-351(-)